jgi:DNA-binding transcriptional MerR regulator
MHASGEFARIAHETIKTPRFYDETGLLKPARVDAASGYRYYRASQLPRLKRILVLKELGFTLEQLAGMLEEGVAATEMQGMLRLRQAEQQTGVQEELNRLAWIE